MATRLMSDVLSAWRGVVAGRAGSVVAILVLALGTGVGITAAAVAYGGLLRPLPFPEADRLVTVDRIFAPTAMPSRLPLDDFARWRERLAASLQLTAYSSERATLRGGGAPREVRIAYVAGGWFQVLGMPSRFGRLVDDASDVDEAVVSSRFADGTGPGDPASVLGRVFTVGNRPLRVVGVLPETFSVISDADIWMLARGAEPLRMAGGRDARSYRIVARVVPGRSVAAAWMHATEALPDLVPEQQKDNWRLELKPLREDILGDSRPVLLAFAAASLLVLLVACANVAMLLVNRAMARTREFAVRVALGASWARIVSIAVMETAIIAVAGALGGWCVARVAIGYLQHTTALTLPATTALPAEMPTLVASGAAALFVLLVCAGAPLVALARAGLASALRTTTTAGSRGGRRMRAALVVFQLSLTVVLLTGAGLLGRTLLAASTTDLGLDAPEGVMTMAVPIGESAADASGQLAAIRRILDETRRLPGVIAAGMGGALPPSSRGIIFTITVSNAEGVDATRAFDLVAVTDGYFEALGARVVEGRLFTPADAMPGSATCVLSEAALKHLALVTSTTMNHTLSLPLPSASGQRVRPRIVGAIEDIRYAGLDAPAHGGVYIPWQQMPPRSAFLVVRTTGDPENVSRALLQVVRDADPSIPVAQPRTLDAVVDEVLAPRAARFGLLGVFAMGASLLGIVGLSGALIRSVAERRRELAIRAAIGASPRRLLIDVMRAGLVLSGLGILLGLLLSAMLAQAIAAMISGVAPRDPVTYGLTAASVLVVALIASYLPARRAASTNPVMLLRAE